jgi:hypothetical protein
MISGLGGFSKSSLKKVLDLSDSWTAALGGMNFLLLRLAAVLGAPLLLGSKGELPAFVDRVRVLRVKKLLLWKSRSPPRIIEQQIAGTQFVAGIKIFSKVETKA